MLGGIFHTKIKKMLRSGADCGVKHVGCSCDYFLKERQPKYPGCISLLLRPVRGRLEFGS